MLSQARTVGLLLAVAIGASSGCVARVHGQARTTTVVEAEPSLVLVDGVWVVEDYDEPVFYDEGYYWRFYGGVWYRSHVHHGNWVRIDVVPTRVRAIDRPTRFVRYRAAANAQKRRGPPPRGERGGGPPDHAPAHGVRGDQPGHDASKADMKEEKAEAKADAKAEKAEAKADAKAEKADAKADAKAAKEAEKAAAKEAKEREKAEKAAAKAAEKEAKEKAKADAKAAKEAERAAAKEAKEKEKAEKAEKAKEEKGGGGGKKGGKKDQP